MEALAFLSFIVFLKCSNYKKKIDVASVTSPTDL